ncbi:hypothetical protein JCM10213v2_004089 [Rhodosporidiobolus nylandii]
MLSRVGSKKVAARPPPVQPASFSPPSTPPTDPLPDAQARPDHVLVARLHELKRLTKSLGSHFSSLAAAHKSYGQSLASLAESEQGLRKEWLQGSLFLPAGEGGWADFCGQARDGTAKEAQRHLELARLAEEQVIDPLRRIGIGIKSFIADLEKHINPLADEVVKERNASVNALTHLATSVVSYSSEPLAIPATEDPVIVRSTAEMQMRRQIVKENELLRIVLLWQDRAKEVEAEVLEKCRACWKWWAEENGKVLLETRQELVKLTQRCEAIAPNAEWAYFNSLNHLIPASTPARSLDLIDYPRRRDPSTNPVKEGLLERKKRFQKAWKEGSLFLPSCTVHPLSAPSTKKGGQEKPAQFVVEGRKSGGTLVGSLGMKAREVSRTFRARSLPTAQAWWSALEKASFPFLPPPPKLTLSHVLEQLSKTSFTAQPGMSLTDRQGPAPTAVQQAGLPGIVEHGEQSVDDGEGEVSSPEDGATEISAAKAGTAGVEQQEKGADRDKRESMVTAYETQPAVTGPPAEQHEPVPAPPVVPDPGVVREASEPFQQPAPAPTSQPIPVTVAASSEPLPPVHTVPAARQVPPVVAPLPTQAPVSAEAFTASPVGTISPALPPRQAGANEPASTSIIAPAPGPGTAGAGQRVLVDSEGTTAAYIPTASAEEKKHRRKTWWSSFSGKK